MAVSCIGTVTRPFGSTKKHAKSVENALKVIKFILTTVGFEPTPLFGMRNLFSGKLYA